MIGFGIITAIIFVLSILFIILAKVTEGDFSGRSEVFEFLSASAGTITIVMFGFLVFKGIELKYEAVRQDKERNYLLSVTEHYSYNADKVKINERVLNYNAWIDSVNAEKEVFGWFAWHSHFNMENHNYIDII